MLPRPQQLAGFLKMQIVWRAEMHHLHRGIVRQLFKRIVRARQAQRFRGVPAAVRRAAENSLHRNAQAAQRFEMRPAYESETHNRCGEWHQCSLDGLRILWREASDANLFAHASGWRAARDAKI